ncbi:hypothetical protein ACQFX9_29765 [Aliinostoc sp. HNIBRCY26]
MELWSTIANRVIIESAIAFGNTECDRLYNCIPLLPAPCPLH